MTYSEILMPESDLPVDSILEKSDLYERHGKNPHAFCH